MERGRLRGRDTKYVRQVNEYESENHYGILDKAREGVEGNLGSDETMDELHMMDRDMPYSVRDEKEKCLERIRSIPIPVSILNAARQNHIMNSFNGIFPEIQRAYMTMDNRLFLWNYYEGNKFQVYEEIDQTIISVGLVRPPDVMCSSETKTKFMLVLTTPVDVILIGIEFEEDSVYSEITLRPTQFSTTTDNVHMLKVLGTPNGRIFMGGKDGNVYELVAEARSSCFRRKCRKLNHSQSVFHTRGFLRLVLPNFLYTMIGQPSPIIDLVVDHGRQLLFALSYDSSIMVYSLGMNGNSFRYICSNRNVAREVLNRNDLRDTTNKTDWNAQNFRIISLHVIPLRESSSLNLVAITNHGHRVYFTFYRYINYIFGGRLYVKYVRMCPESLESTKGEVNARYQNGSSPEAITKAHYAENTLIMADTFHHSTMGHQTTSNGHTLISVHSENRERTMVESVESTSMLGSHILCISEAPMLARVTTEASFLYAKGRNEPLRGLNLLAVQHVLPPRQVLVLTERELVFFQKKRPIDEMEEFLKNSRLKILQERFKENRKEVRTMLLTLACPVRPKEPRDDLRRDPYKKVRIVSEEVKRKAEKAFLDLNLSLQSGTNFAGEFSSVHDALYLYASRLFRPVWFWTLCVSNTQFTFRYDESDLKAISTPLKNLLSFFQKNKSEIVRVVKESYMKRIEQERRRRRNGGNYRSRSNFKGEIETQWKAEMKSLRALMLLMRKSMEAFAILKLAVREVSADSLLKYMRGDSLTLLRTLEFHKLVTKPEGRKLLKALIEALMNIKPETNLLGKLREECPSFFGDSDFKYLQAVQYLEMASGDREQRYRYLEKALRQYKLASRASDFDIKEACKKLDRVHHYPGVVQLALHRASIVRQGEVPMPAAVDSDDFRYNKEIDGVGLDFKHTAGWRQKECNTCYDSILGMLRRRLRIQHHEHEGTQIWSDKKEEKQERILDVQEEEELITKAMDTALSSRDEAFLRKLYSWLIQNKLDNYLYKTRSPLLIEYLKSIGNNSLLGDYYMKNEMLYEAVELFDNMIYNKSTQYTLDDRIHFLIRSQLCVKKLIKQQRFGDTRSAPVQIDSDYEHKLAKQFELAKLQKKILNKMEERLREEQRRGDAKDQERIRQKGIAMKDLNSGLFRIEQLYDTARKMGLWESCLSILKFTGVKKESIVRRFWKNMICERINIARDDWRPYVLETLPDQFVSDAEIFPLPYICGLLEDYNRRYKSEQKDSKYIIKLFNRLKISIAQRIDAYTKLLISTTTDHARNLPTTIIELVNSMSRNERRDHSDSLLILLSNAMAKADRENRQVLERLKVDLQRDQQALDIYY